MNFGTPLVCPFRAGWRGAEGLFRGAVEAKAGLKGLVSSQVLRLVNNIPVCRRPEDDAAFHRAALAGLCLSRSSFRLRAQ